MKKLFSILSAFLCSAHLIQSNEPEQKPADLNELDMIEQESINDIAKDVGIIRFTITLYKDRNSHDVTEWQMIVTKAAQSIYRLQNEQTDSSNILRELNEIVNALQNNETDNGIAGEFTVEASNGEPMKNCCGDNCACLETYRGNCPCSLDSARSNRCLFPQETPFDDQYEQEETSSDTDEETGESFEEVDLDTDKKKNIKRCCK